MRSSERAGRRGRAVAAWLACTVAVGAAAFWLGRRASEAPEVKYHQLTFGHGNVPSARFSPDGASILYTAGWRGTPARIFALRLDFQSEQPLARPVVLREIMNAQVFGGHARM